MVNSKAFANSTHILCSSIAAVTTTLAGQIRINPEEIFVATTVLTGLPRMVEASAAITADIPGTA